MTGYEKVRILGYPRRPVVIPIYQLCTYFFDRLIFSEFNLFKNSEKRVNFDWDIYMLFLAVNALTYP